MRMAVPMASASAELIPLYRGDPVKDAVEEFAEKALMIALTEEQLSAFVDFVNEQRWEAGNEAAENERMESM